MEKKYILAFLCFLGFLQLNAQTLEDTITVTSTLGYELLKDGDILYQSGIFSQALSKVDLSTNATSTEVIIPSTEGYSITGIELYGGGLLFADRIGNRLYTIDPNSATPTETITEFTLIDTNTISAPVDLILEGDDLYVLNYNSSNNGYITKTDLSMAIPTTAVVATLTEGVSPYFMEKKDDTIYVTFFDSHELIAYELTGSMTSTAIFADGEITRPLGMELVGNDLYIAYDPSDPDGKIGVLDTTAMNPSTTFTNVIETDVAFVTGILIERGTLYVSDYDASQIDIFSLYKEWTGAIDNDWDKVGNWEDSDTPTTTDTVYIASGLANYPTASTPVNVADIIMESGATFIPQSTVSASLTYNRNLSTTDWYLAASPVSGETVEDVVSNNALATGTGVNLGLGYYDNSSSGTSTTWSYANATTTATLDSGAGFAVKLASAGDVEFTGAVHDEDVDYSIATGTVNDYYLVGNPFTANISVNEFLTSNGTSTLSESTVWFWDSSLGDYVSHNMMSLLEIEPAVGFFVKAGTTGDITFAEADLSHDTSGLTKSADEGTSLKLTVTSDGQEKSTSVYYVAGKTSGFDNGYDSSVFGGASYDFNVYTGLASDASAKLSIQTLSDQSETIPVGLVAKAGKEVTFSTDTNNIEDGVFVYLENKATGEKVNLSEASYKTTLDADANGVGQFYINISAKSLSAESEALLSAVKVYQSSDKQLTVTGIEGEASVLMYTVSGIEVLNAVVAQDNTVALPSLNAGVYVVIIVTDTGRKTQKIILK